MYEEGDEDVLGVLACAQSDRFQRKFWLILMVNRDYKAAIDDLRDKREQMMTILNEIRASNSSSRSGSSPSKAYINREVSVSDFMLVPA